MSRRLLQPCSRCAAISSTHSKSLAGSVTITRHEYAMLIVCVFFSLFQAKALWAQHWWSSLRWRADDESKCPSLSLASIRSAFAERSRSISRVGPLRRPLANRLSTALDMVAGWARNSTRCLSQKKRQIRGCLLLYADTCNLFTSRVM